MVFKMIMICGAMVPWSFLLYTIHSIVLYTHIIIDVYSPSPFSPSPSPSPLTHCPTLSLPLPPHLLSHLTLSFRADKIQDLISSHDLFVLQVEMDVYTMAKRVSTQLII